MLNLKLGILFGHTEGNKEVTYLTNESQDKFYKMVKEDKDDDIDVSISEISEEEIEHYIMNNTEVQKLALKKLAEEGRFLEELKNKIPEQQYKEREVYVNKRIKELGGDNSDKDRTKLFKE